MSSNKNDKKSGTPRLDEVFMVGIPAINQPGPSHRSALGRVFEAPATSSARLDRTAHRMEQQPKPKAPAQMGKKLKPELEKVVEEYADLLSRAGQMSADEVAGHLREFSHEMEKAEGEDPSELDPGGPAPGTTGGN